MATTFAYEVSPYKREDGTYLVKIRMTHNRKVLRKPSTIYVNRLQLSRDGKKIRDVGVTDTIDKQIRRLRDALDKIDGAEYYEAEPLWQRLCEQLREGNGFRLDIFEYGEMKMLAMEKKTAEGYRCSLNALKRYLGRDTCDINEIDYKMMLDFRHFLETEPALKDGKGRHSAKSKGSRAISYYLTCLRSLHNSAKREYNDDDVVRIPRSPFKEGLIPPQPQTEHRALTIEQIADIMKCECASGTRAAMARDVFMLSFMLIGMNTADLYALKKTDLKDGVITYNRAKTDSVRSDNAMMKVRVEDEVEPYLQRLKGNNGLFCFADRYADARTFNNAVNKGLKEVGNKVGIEGLTTYHARHSWATIARNDCGIDYYTVHEALNHSKRGGERITDIYIEKDWSRIWDANRKVLDLVKS